jgi:hypothetical protein
VDGVATWIRSSRQCLQEHTVPRWVEFFHLDPDLESRDGGERLLQERERLPVCQAMPAGLSGREHLDLSQLRKRGVVVDHQAAVGGRMDVQLHAVGPESGGPPKGVD